MKLLLPIALGLAISAIAVDSSGKSVPPNPPTTEIMPSTDSDPPLCPPSQPDCDLNR